MNCNEIDIFSGNTAIIGVAGADMSRGQLGASMPPSSVRKNVPKSTNPLKSFNWSKLPDCKVNNFFYDKLHDYPRVNLFLFCCITYLFIFQVNGTIWTELDETKLYQVIDLAEIDRLFSAYQKNGLLVSFLTRIP